MKNLQEESLEKVLNSLNSSLMGLTVKEAQNRLNIFGKNEIELTQSTPRYRNFVTQFTNFFALILWTAAALAFYGHSKDPSQGLNHLASSIIFVVLINGLFSFWQEYNAEKALNALKDLLPKKAFVRRRSNNSNSSEIIIEILVSEIVPGDILILNEGDAVPADCRLIVSKNLRVSNATLTGESSPQLRTAEESSTSSDYKALLESHNFVFAGTNVLSGSAEGLVFATGKSTEFGKMANLTQKTEKVLSPLQLEINKISKQMMWIALFFAGACFLVGASTGLNITSNFIFALGVLIANIPEGLLPTVTLALAVKTQKMARRKALVRHLPSVETLGCTTVICTDKTGTLTENRLSAEVVYLNGASYGKSIFRRQWSELEKLFFEVPLYCHSLKENSEGALLGDPLEVALANMSKLALNSNFRVNFKNHVTIPFDSDRRKMSVLRQKEQESEILVKGASEVIMRLCTKVLWQNKIVSLTPEIRIQIELEMMKFSAQGYRVLSFAKKNTKQNTLKEEDESNLILLGLVALHDPPRSEVPDAIKKCHEAHIRLVMITGDHPRTALAIAQQIGMVHTENPRIITGKELEQLSESQLQLAFNNPEVLFARVTGQQKMAIVIALRKCGEIVAVTGDGVNDAPALKAAHIGISMGLSGTSVAKETADVVLIDDNFASIVNAIEEGRSVYENIKKFLTYILTSNIPELIPYLVSVFFLIPLPLTVPLILAVDLGTDLVPALGLGAEQALPEVMKRPPRKQGEGLLNLKLCLRAYFFLGLLEALPAISLFVLYIKNHGWIYGDKMSPLNPIYQEATTLCFSSIVVMQMLNVFLCRHETISIFKSSILKNKMILVGLVFELFILLFVVFTSWGNSIFGTRAFEPKYWILIFPFLLFMLIVEEMRKMVVRYLNLCRLKTIKFKGDNEG